MNKSAIISDCGLYRYTLERRWGAGKMLGFLMLNPSTADANVDDATIRKCMGFATRYGFDAINVVNLYAFRATKPKDMWVAADPVGPLNLDFVFKTAISADPMVCAWGRLPVKAQPHAISVINHLVENGVNLQCLHTNLDGSPGHPCMLSYNRALRKFVMPKTAQRS